jgi:inorganic pyrophosphatase
VRSGSQDQSVDVLVEIPRGSRVTYEMAQKTGRIRLDRVPFSSVHEEPTFPGCVVPSRPIGTLPMHVEHGDDEKILAVPVGDPGFDDVSGLRDLGKHWLREIETFFATYKELESNKTSDVKGWHDADVAWKLIGDARARARRSP